MLGWILLLINALSGKNAISEAAVQASEKRVAREANNSNLGTVLSSGDSEFDRLASPTGAGSYGQNPSFSDDALQDWWNAQTGNQLTTAQRESNAFSASQSALAWQREMYADSTKHQREMADMAKAGINPLMAGVSGSGSSVSAPAATAVSPGSVGSFNLGSILSAISSLAKTKAEIANLNADTSLKEANVNKTTTETEGIEIDNDFKKKINDAKVEGQKLANALSRKDIDVKNKQIDDLEADITLKAKQASTEEERTKYFETASILNRANAYKVAELLPYQKALMSAQTSAEKAAAGLAEVQAAYQQGLIDNGYIENLCKKVAAEAGIAEDSKAILDIKANIRTGNWSGDGVSKFVAKNVLTPLANILDNYNPLSNALSGLTR